MTTSGPRRFLGQVSKAPEVINRVFLLWFFGDFLYAVLPILTLALITQIRGEGYKEFGLIKEWSFAAIVLLGVGIRKFIRLKTVVQKSFSSYRLDTGVQLLVVVLVLAVLVLALVILREKGVEIGANSEFLGRFQLALFAIGGFTLLMATVAEELFSAAANRLPVGVSEFNLSRHIFYRLGHAVETMEYVSYAFQKVLPPRPEHSRNFSRRLQLARDRLETVEELVAEIRVTLTVLETSNTTEVPKAEQQTPIS